MKPMCSKFSKVFIGTLWEQLHRWEVSLVVCLLFFCSRALPLRKLLTVAGAAWSAIHSQLIRLSWATLLAVTLFFFFGLINQITHLAVLNEAAH